MNNESKLRECQNCGGLESSHPIIPTKVGGKYCNHFIQSTTPIEDGKGNEEIAINISEEWNTDADLRLLIKNALDAKDSTHALEKEAVHKKHSVIEARLFAEKKVLEATITSLEDDRTDQELKISALTEKKEGLEREVAELKGIRTNAIKFLDTELCDAHFQESKSQPFDDFHKAQKDAGCRMCLKSKLASQSSQIKKLEEALETIASNVVHYADTPYPLIDKAKQALARFKEGSSHGQ